MKKPVIVTGCGRSGTHWLANILEGVHGEGAAAHEPERIEDVSEVVVDCRLRFHARELSERGHRVVHLVRDGRDVVRSLNTWYGNRRGLVVDCLEWVNAVDLMEGFPTVRLRDLIKRGDPSPSHILPHWTEWDERTEDTFWEICGEHMERLGYKR